MKVTRQSIVLKSSAAVIALASALAFSAAPAFADAYRLDYKVSHSKYGNIGSYSNTIDSDGQNTTVLTRSDIAVRVIGITAYRQSAQREEKWAGDRLVSLHASTDLNGKQVHVEGAAEGDHFQIKTAKGTDEEPALVRVANPWSPELMNGDTIITPDDGVTSKVQITPGQETKVKVAASEVPAKQYNIDLLGKNKHYQVWFDDSGTPVKFNMVDNDGTVTFTLSGKTPVGSAHG